MNVEKMEFYKQLHEYSKKYSVEIGATTLEEQSYYYPFNDKNKYAPIGEIKKITKISPKKKAYVDLHYYILDSINKKPHKVKI